MNQTVGEIAKLPVRDVKRLSNSTPYVVDAGEWRLAGRSALITDFKIVVKSIIKAKISRFAFIFKRIYQ
jgi:hypothetical protein